MSNNVLNWINEEQMMIKYPLKTPPQHGVFLYYLCCSKILLLKIIR